MSDPNQPREVVLERRMLAIYEILHGIKGRVACTCDFTEHGQMADCPHVLVGRAFAIAAKTVNSNAAQSGGSRDGEN